MFSTNTKIDSAPSHESLKHAKWAAWTGVALTAATVPLMPAAPLLHLAAIPFAGLAAVMISRQYARVVDDFKQLGAKRGFEFPQNVVPRKRDKSGRLVPPVSEWIAEWPPFDLVLIEESFQGVATQVWQKRLCADSQWSRVLDAQSDWILQHAQPRFKVIEDWWHRWWLQPLLNRRHGVGAALGAKEVGSAAAAVRVDLLIGMGIGGQDQLWDRRLGSNWDKRCYRELCDALKNLPNRGLTSENPPPFPVYRQPRYGDVFLGHGFMLDQRHTQALEDLKLRNLSEVTDDPAEQGDPRIFGVGHRDKRDIFVEEAQLNQMAGIFGSNGVGKTRYAEVLITQAIRNGYPVVVIDPKSDDDLLNRMAEEARRMGRGHQFRYFSLAAPTRPETWEFLCRYNPCSDYNDPAELSSRIAALIPSTKDPFWSNRAKGMVETCMTLCHWVNWYLRFIDRDPVTGDLAPKGSRRVPRVLLAMQWARHHLEATPEEANLAVEEIIGKMQNRGWQPTREDEREVVALLMTKSLAQLPIYCPNEWVPTVRHVSEYMIDGTVGFMGWILRSVFPHLYLSGSKIANPNFPRVASDREIISKGNSQRGGDEEASMWSAYLSASVHPLELRYEANLDVPSNLKRWVAFYDYFVPHRPDLRDDYYLGRLFENIRKRLVEHATECGMERQKFTEQASTLNSAIKPFLGDIGRLMCAIDSDIRWEDVVDQNQIVYCGLASMVNRIAAQSAAKLLAEDFTSYIGRRYQYDNVRPPVYLIADEISTFISDGFIDLLNKARGAGMRGVIIGQTTPDLSKNLGADGAKQTKGNLNTFVQLRSMLAEDAEDFSRRAGEAAVVKRSRNQGLTPGVGKAGHQDINGYSENTGGGTSEKDAKKVPSSAVLNLPRGQAFIHVKGLVYLVAQGLFKKPLTNYPIEIGYKPGVMTDLSPTGVEPVAPPQRARSKTRTAHARPPTQGRDSNPSTPATPKPTTNAVATAVGSTPVHGATFRSQTDALALPDEPSDTPNSDPYPAPLVEEDNRHPSSVERASFDDDAPPAGRNVQDDEDLGVV